MYQRPPWAPKGSFPPSPRCVKTGWWGLVVGSSTLTSNAALSLAHSHPPSQHISSIIVIARVACCTLDTRHSNTYQRGISNFTFFSRFQVVLTRKKYNNLRILSGWFICYCRVLGKSFREGFLTFLTCFSQSFRSTSGQKFGNKSQKIPLKGIQRTI